MVRVRGRLAAVDGYPTLTPTDTREIVYSILGNDQRQKLENNWQLDFAYQIPGRARFRVNAYFQRSALGAAFRLIPFEIAPLESLGLPPAVAEMANRPRGLVLVTGPTGSGKSTTLASLIDVINETREEHIMTIEDPIEFLHRHKKVHRQPARARLRRDHLRRGAEGRAAPGPGRDPRRRDARHGDDLDRDHRGGDRPPRVRHAAHAGHAADDRPHRRRLPRRPAGPDPHAALGRPAGDRHPAAAADRRRRGALRRRRGARADAGRAQPDPRGQDAPDLLGAADRRRARDADDGRRAGWPRARRADHPPARGVALHHAGRAAAAARDAAAWAFRRPTARWRRV